MQSGDKEDIRVGAEEASGPREPGATRQVPMDRSSEHIAPEVRMRLTVQGPQGEDMAFAVSRVSEGPLTLDFNDPQAGENLTSSVTVRDVRSAGGGPIVLTGDA